MQPGFFHGYVLILICGSGAIQVEERPDLTPRNHVWIVRVAGARAGWCTRRILRQLADLFFSVICCSNASTRFSMRHPSEESEEELQGGPLLPESAQGPAPTRQKVEQVRETPLIEHLRRR